MATPTPSKSAPNNSNPKPVADPTPKVDAKNDADPQPTEPAKTESTVAPVQASDAAPTAKSADKTIISLSVPEKLARQVRLLSKLEGKSISAIFLDAVAGEIPSRLRVALATIVED